MDNAQNSACQFEKILLFELIPAQGCTEPIAIALCCAKAREVLGEIPERMDIYCSTDIIKNANSVVVPNSGGIKGIAIAAALGLIGGDSDKKLEVLSSIADEHRERARLYTKQGSVKIHLEETDESLYIRAEVQNESDRVVTEIRGHHTNFSRIEKNGVPLIQEMQIVKSAAPDTSGMTLSGILDWIENVDILSQRYDSLRGALDRQIEYNMAIGEEGMAKACGVEVGRTLLQSADPTNFRIKMIAYAAAGSDARMGGCDFPVVINSGSGNQGMTISIPVVFYAKEHNTDKEKLYRALLLGNLVSVYIKSHIGRLSAFCGVVSAAAASGAAIGYLEGFDYKRIGNIITITLATSGGIFCDGAKASCAAKIATALTNALLAVDISKNNKAFSPGDGIVGEDIEKTIQNIGNIARHGMKSTDEEILKILI